VVIDEEVRLEQPDRWAAWRPSTLPIEGTLLQIAYFLLGIGAIGALWLRFSTSSLLWLDEAQTVNIAKQPLHQLPHLLKEDGAPPLYYFLLHLWMGLVGSSDAAVRSLSGLISVATVIVTFFVVRRVWGTETGVVAAVLLGASPFATYYATETRMYSLVMLLVALGIGALARLYEAPSIGRMVLVAAVAAALAYTQYWSFYLFATMALWFLIAALVGDRQRDRPASLYALAALGLAGVAFLPWLPTFLFQRSHTGTPWGSAPNFLTAVVAVFHFHSNQALQVARSDLRQRGMEAIFIVLFILALFGSSQPGRWLRLNPRTEPRGRFLAWMIFSTLVLGVVVSHFTNNAFTPRYGSVVYVPLMVFLALGVAYFRTPSIRVLLVFVVALGFMVGGYQESRTQRTQAQQVVDVLRAHAEPGDVALFCPDELGPTVLRILPSGTLRVVGFPRFTSPDIVNWVDYDKVLNATDPSTFVARSEALATTHRVWLIWSPGYGASGPACTRVAQALATQRGWTGTPFVDPLPQTYFQSMQVIEYRRTG
jgi:4-amino-4-deoxy-L-arabinose transferase-like glycosyltransferase